MNLDVVLPTPHRVQAEFVRSEHKRNVVRAGRRGGKTVGMSIRAVERFLQGRRVLYATPTQDQIGRFWFECKKALDGPIGAKIFKVNETLHEIILPGTEQRIRAKTAWNADTLRGDFADELILDEYQLMDETAWSEVGAPMLLDNNGNASFIYTPPSLHSRSVTKARDPQHAAKLFKLARTDTSGRWATFHFASRDNPFISRRALDEIAKDMTGLAYRQEILAEDIDEAPGALWTREVIERNRSNNHPDLERVVVGVDPTASSAGDEAGIVTGGRAGQDYYTLSDASMSGSPQEWAGAAVAEYHKFHADLLVAEKNNGGEMVEAVIKQVDPSVNVRLVWASRGKQTRAEPISAIAEQGRDHHVGTFTRLEDEMCMWVPGDPSPNRMDAKVWMMTALLPPASADVLDISKLDW